MDHVTLLGVKGGPAIRQGGAMPTASLLQMDGTTIVVDTAIGVSRSLVEAGISLLEIDAIFITHLHSDHVLELGGLIYTAWTTGLTTPIKVYGPDGIEAYWDGFLASMAFDQAIRIEDEGRIPIRNLVQIETFAEGQICTLGEIEISALRVDHPPVTDCFALKFQTRKAKIVFSADTCYFPALAPFAQGADILIHEAMLTHGIDAIVRKTNAGDRLRKHLLASHTPAEGVGRIAAAAQVRKLVLNHLVPVDDPNFTNANWDAEVSKTWDGEMIVGVDGLRIPF